MNGLDLVVALAALAAFVGGYRTGLLARLSAWAGTLLGLVLGARNLTSILARLGTGTQRPAVVIGTLIGCTLGGRLVGGFFGRWVQHRLPGRPLRRLNRVAGGAAGLAGVALVLWLTAPLVAQIPGWPAGATRSSVIATTLSNRVPFRTDVVTSARRLLANGRLPDVLGTLGPALSYSRTTGSSPVEGSLSQSATRSIASSVFLVRSRACGVESDGTGFAIDAHRVLTNAHVVAGNEVAQLVDELGVIRRARVVDFDPVGDLALLDIGSDALRPLRMTSGGPSGSASSPVAVAVFGHPGGESLRVANGTLLDQRLSRGRDIYDRGRAPRSILVLDVDLRPGDSGAPIVASNGEVLGIAFAIAPDVASTAYGLAQPEITAFVRRSERGASSNSAGPCLRG